jgi:hypothetical protein
MFPNQVTESVRRSMGRVSENRHLSSFGEHFLERYFLALGPGGTHGVTRPEFSS